MHKSTMFEKRDIKCECCDDKDMHALTISGHIYCVICGRKIIKE